MTITELDTLRAETMRTLLNEEGRRLIWRYDVIPLRDALTEALERQNYDGIHVNGKGLLAGHRYAFVGAGIEDHPFSTPDELVALVTWLCTTGYLSCHAATGVTS